MPRKRQYDEAIFEEVRRLYAPLDKEEERRLIGVVQWVSPPGPYSPEYRLTAQREAEHRLVCSLLRWALLSSLKYVGKKPWVLLGDAFQVATLRIALCARNYNLEAGGKVRLITYFNQAVWRAFKNAEAESIRGFQPPYNWRSYEGRRAGKPESLVKLAERGKELNALIKGHRSYEAMNAGGFEVEADSELDIRIDTQHKRIRIEQLLGEITPRAALAIRLRYGIGIGGEYRNYREISQILECEPQKAKNLLTYGISALKQAAASSKLSAAV